MPERQSTDTWADGSKGKKKCECGGEYTPVEYSRHLRTAGPDDVNEHNENFKKRKGGVSLGQ